MGKVICGSPVPVGQVIRRLRKAAHLSQRELAEMADVSVGLVRDLEQGRTSWPHWRTIKNLSAALGIDITEPDAAQASSTEPQQRSLPPSALAILGPFTAARAGHSVVLGGARQQAVVGLLALRGDSAVRPDEISELIWRDRPPPTAATIIQGHISSLRRILVPPDGESRPQVIAWTGAGYRLAAAVLSELDSAIFADLIRRGNAATADGNAVRAARLYERGLDLWRGDVLETTEALRVHPLAIDLNMKRSEVTVAYADAVVRAGAPGRALAHLRGLCRRDPYNEQAAGRLMLALAAIGQSAAAISEFDQLRDRLRRELGIGPSPYLLRAHRQIMRSRAPADFTLNPSDR